MKSKSYERKVEKELNEKYLREINLMFFGVNYQLFRGRRHLRDGRHNAEHEVVENNSDEVVLVQIEACRSFWICQKIQSTVNQLR